MSWSFLKKSGKVSSVSSVLFSFFKWHGIWSGFLKTWVYVVKWKFLHNNFHSMTDPKYWKEAAVCDLHYLQRIGVVHAYYLTRFVYFYLKGTWQSCHWNFNKSNIMYLFSFEIFLYFLIQSWATEDSFPQ